MAQTNDLSQAPTVETGSPYQNDGKPVGGSNDGYTTPSRPGLSQNSSPKQGHQRLVFTDPVAFQYLTEDPSVVVLDRRRILTGYEIYIVEQWACSRIHPTYVINTYTGDPSHSAVVGVLSIPADESSWSERLKVYFDAVSQFHARKRETPLGTLIVTNLSSFPSALTVIAVPDGDVRKHRLDFVVNEDLKRLGCSGRAGLNLRQPTAATEAKFHQLYRTSERVPFYGAVMELVKQCQIALTIFDKLAPEYVDGLLCDVTERAINDWWTDIGTDFFNIEPSDGILGPTTVAALLGMLMGARNRLHAYGAPVAKDAFDVTSLKRGIGSFQKSQRLDRTRRLDRQTLDRLQRVTAKAASGDSWTVPRAVKSTVAELGGKGGEMVMGMVGGRDKAGISEVETLDMERFVQLVSGERAKWLWHGKPRKTSSDLFRQANGDGELVFAPDEHGGFAWMSKRRETTPSNYNSVRPSLDMEQSPRPVELPNATDEREQQLKLALKKSVSGKVSDARAGFGRFREAVGLPGIRSHHHKRSKDGVDLETDLQFQQDLDPDTNLLSPKDAIDSTHVVEEDLMSPADTKQKADQVAAEQFVDARADLPTNVSEPPNGVPSGNDELQKGPDEAHVEGIASQSPPDDMSYKARSRPASQSGPKYLRRPRSFNVLPGETDTWPSDSRWPRHLSFSAVEDTILVWEDIGKLGPTGEEDNKSIAGTMLREDMLAFDLEIFSSKVLSLNQATASWVEKQVSAVESLDQRALDRLEDLNAVYKGKLEDYHSLHRQSTELVDKEGSSLMERSKKVELLAAKLDYELDALQSRIEEVEHGLDDYERHIFGLERRVKYLVKQETNNNTSSWFNWGAGLLRRASPST